MALGKREVMAFIGDGSMLMNLQELQTIVHHALPVKIWLFENDGYGMIKATFDSVKKQRVGVDKATGFSCPDFINVAGAFGLETWAIKTWEDFDNVVPWMLSAKGPALTVVHLDPEQQFVPRLKPTIENGVITPARFDALSPILA